MDKQRSERGLATQMHPIEHVKKRPSIYIGSKTPEYIKIWLYSNEAGRFSYSTIKVAPGFFKIIDEIIVNAIDQHIIFPKDVDSIKIDLLEDGSISVANNGRGFNLHEKTKTLDGTIVWNPELCAGHMLTSDNYDDDSARITGGMNGIGMKATNIFSKKFKLVTQDGDMLFKQEFRNNLTEKDEPIVRKVDNIEKADYTKITFLPDYEFFAHSFSGPFADTIKSLLFTRAFQSAVFTGIGVTCIGIPLTATFEQFCQKHLLEENQSKLVVTKIRETLDDTKPLNDNHPMNIGFSFSTLGVAASVLMVNGVHCYGGGTLVESIRQQITTKLRPRIDKMIEKKFGSVDSIKIDNKKIHDCTFVFIMGQVDKPEFDSQAKAILKTDKKRFKNYNLEEEFIDKCWEILKDSIYDLCMASIRKKLVATSSKKTMFIENYEPARTKKDRTKATLLVVEGLSAKGAAANAISNPKQTGLSEEFYGIYPLLGVPVNAKKMVDDDKDDNGASAVQNLQRILENDRFSELVQIIGLRPDAHYDLTPEGDAQYTKLRYGRVVLVSDADFDGNLISGLCSSNILLFWPCLLKRRFIRKLNTPIVRAWTNPKNKISFYSLQDYNHWAEQAPSHSTKYCKGLGSNNKQESIEMFKGIEKKLIDFGGDDHTFKLLDQYFGKNTDIRKTILAIRHSEEGLRVESTMSEFLSTEVHSSQRYNVSRKIPSLFDGNTLAKRKAIWTALGEMNEKEIVVFQLTGDVSKKAAYHHGEKSMNDTIIKMAQTYPGGKILPPFLPEGSTGSFKEGGKDKASPRYVSVRLNYKFMHLNYPKEDEYVLDYEFDQGKRHEPSTYYTVLPNCIMEYVHIPATGWSTKIIPRSYKEVLSALIELLLLNQKDVPPLSIHNYNGSNITFHGGEEFASEGEYTWNPQTGEMKITKLPLYVFPVPHSAGIFKKEGKGDNAKKNTYLNPEFHSEKPKDSSNEDRTDLTYYISKKGREYIRTLDRDKCKDWELNFFDLRSYLKPNINFLEADGSVKSFATYEQAFMGWFAGRKKIYAKRLIRQSVVFKMQILRLANKIRFIRSIAEFGNMSRLKEEELNAKLEELEFDRLNSNLVSEPGFIPPDDIEHTCRTDSANYKYLSMMPIISLTSERCNKFVTQKEELERQLRELGEDFEEGFIGRKTWLKEVLAIKKILDAEIPRYWSP